MDIPVKFSNPPLNEVACGVLFDPVGLKTVHLGQLWDRFRAEFPRYEDANPIPPVIEPPPGVLGTNRPQVSFNAEIPRVWFLDADGVHLIQVQSDRFLFNWKRNLGSEAYPSFEVVYKKFESYLAEFAAFLQMEHLKPMNYRQYEVIYVNLITDKNGGKQVGNGAVLTDHTIDNSRKRFLPEPDTFAWNTSYLLPENSGRLHMIAQSAVLNATQEKVMRVEYLARGVPSDNSEAKRKAWFDTAHKWITHGFADSTSPVLQKLWERTS